MHPQSGPKPQAESPDAVQVSAASVPDGCWDVVVVGAGPGGASAAIHLARRGYRVLLLDRAEFPRDKVCGDGLLAESRGALERLGIFEEVRRHAHQVPAAALFSPSRIEVRLPGDFLTLRRRELDALLARAASRAGAVFARGDVRRVDPGGEEPVAVLSCGRPFRSRFLLLATGADLRLPRTLGAERPSRGSAVAVRCYVRSASGPSQLVVSYDRTLLPGYAWIFPLGNGLYNVGCGTFTQGDRKRRTNLAKAFRTFRLEFPIARHLFERGTQLTPLSGAQLRCGLWPGTFLTRGRILAVGEAASSTYPLTGEGVGKALQTGELAAETVDRALESGDPAELSRYPRQLALLRRRYRGYEIGARWLSQAWMGDLLAFRANQSRHFRARAAEALAGRADPREFFSLRALFRSYLE